ncbi:opioid growth factor receptor-like protein 1 isoform X2 [Ornithorhynchus anatinus]|uniref:opioid growth factor receptor-like protein 1 isoform X2 n=1 Tax=Ornithorhynchus anatinus TaxID=9258 RepID=UPI0010A8BF0B|nr:opioid growth factor receptor-like protein 1 isoform X2 [Ornithorhynchus anatinus]
MGNLLSGVSPREPATVEDCDSTWQTDSEPEPDPEPGGSGGPGPGQGAEPQPDPAGPPADPAGPRQGDAEAEGRDQSDDANESTAKPKRSFYAARDLYKYRHQYPNFKDLRYQNDLSNLRFYKNKIPFKPDGVYIEEVLNKWKGDYEKLEHNHTYIQWLFPLREQGLNFYAKELTTYEIEEFKKTKEAIRRFLLAYKMMLEFFGIKLIDKTGNVTRAANWQERFQHLNESQHNYLRITRILKSLGELGYESFKSPLVKFILQEALVENTIPNIKQSALEYFVYTIRDRRERRKLLRFAQKHYIPSEHFIWGPSKKQKSTGSKATKTPVPPAAPQDGQISTHKKSKDPKTTPLTANESGKAAEEKDLELRENGEENDQVRVETICGVADPESNEKGSETERPDAKIEKTISNSSDKKENISLSEKGEDSENQDRECENEGATGTDFSDDDTKNSSTSLSENQQTSLGQDKSPVDDTPQNND